MESIFRYIQENKKRFIDEVLQLVQQPSISIEKEGMQECAKLFKDRMTGMGIRTRLISGGGPSYIFGEINNPDASMTVLFMDTTMCSLPARLNYGNLILLNLKFETVEFMAGEVPTIKGSYGPS